MQKYLIGGLVLLLAGCQSTSNVRPAPFFINPFNNHSSFAPAQSSLAQSVQSALMRSEDPMIAQVHVEARQNIVVLSGYVKKIRQSDTAELIARQVPGVQSVENRIIIRP